MEISELKVGTCFVNYMESLSMRLWKVWTIYRFSDIFHSELEIGSVSFQVIDLDSGEAMTVNYDIDAARRVFENSGEIDPSVFDKAMKLRGMYMSGLHSIAESLYDTAKGEEDDEDEDE